MASSSSRPSHRSVFDAAYIRAEFEAAGVSPHFIPLIWKYVLQNPRCADLDGVPSLPAAAYALLRNKFRPTTSTLTAAAESKDRTTTKLLIRLQNGESVEAVIMRYDSRLGKYDGKTRPGGVRSTLCVSSQVGCKMGCRFCATGTMGFKSNLTSGEIVEQLVHASRYSQIRNIVFMGMGEPLNNYTALVEAIQVLTASPFQISPKRVTVSTVGIIHSINKFNNDLPNINLAVSLHAPDQDIHCHIMPAARAFPLAKLMNALQSYQSVSKQTIFIEYIMLDGVNDQEEHAHQLCKLLETFKVAVTSTGVKKGGLYSFDVAGVYKYKSTLVDVKVDTQSNISTTLTVLDVLPSTKLVTSVKLPDYNSGKVELQYFHEHATFSTAVGMKPSPVVEFSGAVGPQGLAIGGEAGFDTSSGKFTKYTAGIGVTKPEFHASFILADKGDTIKVSGVYHLDEKQKASAVAEFTRKLSTNENALTVGGLYTVDPQTTVKARLNNTGTLAALLQHELKPKSILTISGEFDTKALDRPPKFGLALALKP